MAKTIPAAFLAMFLVLPVVPVASAQSPAKATGPVKVSLGAPEPLGPGTGDIVPASVLWPEAAAEPDRSSTCIWVDEGKPPFRQYLRNTAHLVWEDYQHFYDWENLGILGLEVAVAAPLANTNADQHIHEWYQREVRSRATNDVAVVAKQFGEVVYVVPVYLAAWSAGRWGEETGDNALLGEWGGRSLRALIVGAPALGALQFGLGSGRPDSGTSAWRPFHSSHGASGHAFLGSVPFLTAASMTDNPWIETPLVAASFLTAFSRINDGAHFTSQAFLGWCLGCGAVLSVNATEREERDFRVLPVAPLGEPGASVEIRY